MEVSVSARDKYHKVAYTSFSEADISDHHDLSDHYMTMANGPSQAHDTLFTASPNGNASRYYTDQGTAVESTVVLKPHRETAGKTQ